MSNLVKSRIRRPLPMVNTGRPDAQQVNTVAPGTFVGIAGISQLTGKAQNVWVDGNETDNEKPVPTGLLKCDSYLTLFDEGLNAWHRQRGNYNETLIPSGAFSASQLTGRLDNFNARGGHFVINVTAFAGTGGGGAGNITPTIYGYDYATGGTYPILVGNAITATGVIVMKVYPGIATVAGGAASDILPRFFMFGMAHTTATATYTVSLNLSL